MFDWDYAIGYNLTKSLQFNFRATNNNIYDDFFATDDIRLFDNFFTTGRPDHYHQSLNGTYKIPLNKIPFLEFVNADYAYTADFDWQASSQSYVDKVGNVIQNANTHILGFDLDFNVLNKKETPTSCRGFFVFQCLDTTPVISHILMLKLIIVVLSLGNVLSPDVFNICGKLF